MNFFEHIKHCQTQVNQALDLHLPPPGVSPARLHEAMRYAVLNGGKRLRPTLVYTVGLTVGASFEQLHSAACAVELIHAYSLIHDDLPAMDNDELRRGLPTCHKAFDEATAILAGDALQALAFQILAEDKQLSSEQRLNMITTLANAAGSRGMAGGQALDLEAEGKKLYLRDLENIYSNKTGALIRASARLGALAAHATHSKLLTQLDNYAQCIGLAFQIQDDILDMEKQEEISHKPTYPNIAGIANARIKIQELREKALVSLSYFSPQTTLLKLFSEYILGEYS